ncbi:ribosome biogenesis protein Kri1 [Blumeria hordei DH14]|uniref:Ribosome biogenesis protein Kri1 n=1 Tax=Blumeria graminis f. sp. hordei (strain DH14) TaxID=546991 RepID=N1JCK7_BLUG1|nr:ribosome biogenesis protein Kri1 [Blumeria hordei DH14]
MMAKRKTSESNTIQTIRHKKLKHNQPQHLIESILTDNTSSESEAECNDTNEPKLKINKEFARKFEHNKQREELQKLDEKYNNPEKNSNRIYGDKYDEDSESSNSEEEDDAGLLATETLDAEISATLNAIRSKDPHVYDENFTFFTPIADEIDSGLVADAAEKHKPMYLRDYHRENLLKGLDNGEKRENESESNLNTFAQEQTALQTSLIKQIHDAAEDESEADENGGFLIPEVHEKKRLSTQACKVPQSNIDIDVNTAHNDPDKFLSNFMAARAWVPTEKSRFQPLESDNESEDDRAERFETAYNLRFEDPTGSNEILKTYARDVVAAKSVRRDNLNSRKKQRTVRRDRKEEERQKQKEEIMQLKRLKIEEMENRLKMIKKAAGIRGESLNQESLLKFLEEGWDDERWKDEMTKYFGEKYYADKDQVSDDAMESEAKSERQKRLKKPEWDDDIDINDILPGFEETVQASHVSSHSGSEADNQDVATKLKTRKIHQLEKHAKKKSARIERMKIENLVDSQLDVNLLASSTQRNQFRYRETSPVSFGLTALDILMAPEKSLNEFAGIKKMATFRDAEKKRKDKKHLGKKSRLRQWRKETFGNEEGPAMPTNANNTNVIVPANNENNILLGGRKKKRSRKAKVKAPN